MLRRTLTILALFVFISGIGYSQLKPQKATKIDPNNPTIGINNFVPAPKHFNKPASDQLIFTDYDYAGNNSIPNMVDMYDFTGDGNEDLVATAMQRFDATNRRVKMIVGNRVDGFTDFDAGHASAGWGTLAVGRTGPWNNQAVVAYHSGGNSWVSTTDMTSLTPTFAAAFAIPGNFPSFVYKDNGEVYMTNTNGELFKSTDQTTYTSTGVFFDPAAYPVTGFNSEYLLKKSPNGMYLAHVGCWTVAGEGGPGGVPDDSTDFIGMNYSSDGGATWTFELMGREGLTPVANRTGYLPLFENFGQVNFVVDNSGVVHVGLNGYGYRITATDTSFSFPAIYWNSRDKQWLAASDPVVEVDIDTAAADYVTNRPGNGIGNAYVVPSISEDGSKIVLLWQGPEYSGAVGASPVNQWTVTATDVTPIIYTDLYYAVSGDGGKTWSAPALLPNQSAQLVQESYPSPNNYLLMEGDSMYVHFVYMIDDIPGTSLFASNNTGNNNTSWNYDVLALEAPAVTTVNVEFQVDMGVQAFKGKFNPATDAVKVAGNFNGWNNGADVMTDLDGDTVYTITKALNPGDTLYFKFIKGADGWEQDPNRQYVVPAVGGVFSDFFDRDNSYQILTPVNITFACNMEFEIVSGRFNPAADTLSARGSFNGWSSAWVMAPSVGDPNIYEVTKSINTFDGEVFNYKYAYIHGPATSWENDPNKTYTVTAADISSGFAYALRTYNDATLSTVTNNPCTIKFTVDVSSAVSAINLQPLAPVTDVRICGANYPLQWPAGGWPNADSTFTIKLFDDGTNGDVAAGDQIWTREVTFPQYSPLRIQYKYGANWALPTNQGGNDNENGVGADHFINLTPDMTYGVVNNIFGTMGDHPVITDVTDQLPGVPTVYDLVQNFPNPFNPSTSVRFSIPEAGLVTLKVYSLLGEEVATLVNEFKNAGNYNVNFDASGLTSGVYVYRISAGNYTASKKMMLMK
jgi:hypothetical protein